MQRVIQMGYGFIAAVDGQGVLNQVVRPDGEKIKLLQEVFSQQCGGRYFNHRTQPHRAYRHATSRQFATRQLYLSPSLASFI